ncbi:MAG: FtsX-like permease family protein [Bacteroidetes bacterium]|nr:FtsX-like permease family protein [Bacteroidota bacterium]
MINRVNLNFSFYIAKRYLFARKSKNVINIISAISVVGVSIGTMALIVILSVFNGFNNLVQSLFNSFDPDIKITIKEGKTFSSGAERIQNLKKLKGVLYMSEIIEENALLKYDDRQYIVTVKGVSDEFINMSGIDSMIIDGEFILKENKNNYAVIGQGVALNLAVGLNFITPINIYVPKRTQKVSLNPEKAFSRKYIYPSGIFAIQQDFDSRYIIVPIDFARDLLDYSNEVSAIELKLDPVFNKNKIQEEIKKHLGTGYEVKNRFEQQELLYKIMKSEKWAIFLILTFILIIASFNVIGSLTMLIIEKKKDIDTLRSLGTNLSVLRKIFLFEGWMISILGAILGLMTGTIICWIQQHFGLIKIQGSDSFVIDTYPVNIELPDFIYVFLTVLFIGYLAAWYPVRYITRKFLIDPR